MRRRELLGTFAAGCASLALGPGVVRAASRLSIGPALPDPLEHSLKAETVINSRRSVHSGYAATLSSQVLSNALWAASRAPRIASTRLIFAGLPDGVYRYDEATHSLALHKSGNFLSEPGLAFEICAGGDLAEDSAMALHYAQLAATAFATAQGSTVLSCPKGSCYGNANATWDPGVNVHIGNCYGAGSGAEGISSELVATSSDGSLPDPATSGAMTLEGALGRLAYGSSFAATPLAIEQLSQILWASYGCTPHTADNRAALSVASGTSSYVLTNRIYLVSETGVARYLNRQPSGDMTTRDHRLAALSTGDKRPALRGAIPRLPQSATAYIVFCVGQVKNSQFVEAGLCGASALLQATTLGLQGYCSGKFTTAERGAIATALGLAAEDLPSLIFSVGYPLEEAVRDGGGRLRSAATQLQARVHPLRGTVEISGVVASPGRASLAIYDLGGRLRATLFDRRIAAGGFSIAWDGCGGDGRRLPAGQYLGLLQAVGQRSECRLVLY